MFSPKMKNHQLFSECCQVATPEQTERVCRMKRKDKEPPWGNDDDRDAVNLSKAEYGFRVGAQFFWEEHPWSLGVFGSYVYQR